MPQRIQAIIFDWAGTTIDYGCFAPMHAFIGAFKREGIEVTHREVRKPMGLLKKDHLHEMLKMERIAAEWNRVCGRLPEEKDVEILYGHFEELLMESLHLFTVPVPGALTAVADARRRNLKIGSTTGYTKRMMKIVAPGAKQHGYEPDFLICSDEVAEGRPHPYMIQANLEAFGIVEPQRVIKVGDTISDVQEGKNAGTWTVAILEGGSELGLTESDLEKTGTAELAALKQRVTAEFKEAGADFVIDSIKELPVAIDSIEALMQGGRAGEPVL